MAGRARCHVEWEMHSRTVHPKVEAKSRNRTGDIPIAGSAIKTHKQVFTQDYAYSRKFGEPFIIRMTFGALKCRRISE